MENFYQLLKDNILVDVNLTIQDANKTLKPIYFHRLVLVAFSPYFKALFTNNCKESNMTDITIIVPSADVTYDIIMGFYGQKMNTSNIPSWQYLFKQIRCYDFMQLPIDKLLKQLYILELPKNDINAFEQLVSLLEISCTEYILQVIKNNIPDNYDFSKLTNELLLEIKEMEVNYDILFCGSNSSVCLWKTQTGLYQDIYKNPSNRITICCLAYTEQYKYFALNDSSNIFVIDLKTGKEITHFNDSPYTIHGICFVPDTDSIIFGGGRRKTGLSNTKTNQNIPSIQIDDTIRDVHCFKKKIFILDYDKCLYIHNLEIATMKKYYLDEYTYGIITCENNDYFATIHCDGVIVWTIDYANQELIEIHQFHEKKLPYACFSPNGKYFAISSGNCISIYQINTNDLAINKFIIAIEIIDESLKHIMCITWSADNKWIVVGDDNYTIQIYNAQTGQKVKKIITELEIICQIIFIEPV